MRLGALGVIVLLASGLPACTTVDLSQVAVQSESIAAAPVEQNVVERASASLTAAFRSKGWCSGGPQEITQTATSVLLNGVDSTAIDRSEDNLQYFSEADLVSDLIDANDYVVQTTKAAEVFLSISEEITDIGDELSLLETALLATKEAESRFDQAVLGTGSSSVRQNFEALQTSALALKKITDTYGARARSTIATRSSASRS